MEIFYSGCTCIVIFIKDWNTAYVSVRHNYAAARQNNVPSESSFATKSALFGPKNVCPFQILDLTLWHIQTLSVFRLVTVLYRILGIFRVGLIFAEFASSLKSPKMDTAKNKPYYTCSLRVLKIAKIWLGENLTHLPSGIFANISRREKFPIYGILYVTRVILKIMRVVEYLVNHDT